MMMETSLVNDANVTNQKEKILRAIEQFIKGADESDVQKLSSVLHKEFRNVQYSYFGEPGVYIMDKGKYISLIKEKAFGGITRDMEIVSVEIHNRIAMVKLRLESSKLIFNSFISLIFDEQRWEVISNFPDVITK